MNQLLTEDELAKHLRVSRSFLWGLRKKGLPFILIGRAVRYEPQAVAEYFSKHQNEKTATSTEQGGDE